MLGLFGRKSDHPLADLKSAQALLADLPKHDALKALQELTGLIETLREQEFRLDHQFVVLRLLDEAARPFERKLERDYFAVIPSSTFQENRLWMALNEFFEQVLLAYRYVLARYRNGDKGASSIRAMLPLIAARGIGAVAGKLKFAAARYALVDQALWECLAEFYAHAEAQQYLGEQLALYAGAGAKTSVRDEFAAVLMWYATSFGSLSRINMHLAERLTALMGKHFSVSAQRGPDSRFVFDLRHPMSPMRLGAETVPQPGLLFLGVEKFQPQIDALRKTLEKGVVPEELNLGGKYEAAAVRAVALHLASCLASPPPVRRNVRHSIQAKLSVAHGYSGIMEQAGNGLNFGSAAGISWLVQDISTSGLHCVLPAAGADRLDVGALIGIKPEKRDSWGVGIVRRIFRDPQKNLHAGIEMLASQVAGVGLRERVEDEEQHAMWLDSPGGNTGEVDLLLGLDAFSGSRSLHARVNDKRYLLMPLKLVEKGEGYDLARYRKIEEDAASEEAY